MTDHLYSLSHCHLFCLAGLVEYVPAIWKITSSHEGFSTVSSRPGVLQAFASAMFGMELPVQRVCWIIR